MKESGVLTSENTVLHALAKGVCPLCALVRAYQNELIERLRPTDASKVCSYHAWAIAAGAPASSAAEVFLAMLREESSAFAKGEWPPCDLCSLIRTHELTRLREFADEMQKPRFVEWIEKYGTVCRFHGAELLSRLSEEKATIIRKVIENNRQELHETLMNFAAKVRSGKHGGGGVLGHVAEFLIAQRGLTR